MGTTERATHTPGPWKSEQKIAGGNRQFGIVSRSAEFDAEQWPYHPLVCSVYRGFGFAPRHIAEANARLIAAAPDLLAELKRLVRICDTDALLPDGSNPDTQGAHALIDAIESTPCPGAPYTA